jgi:tRNA A-37 threonylcarbamoyl transferase component Bud32
LLLLLASPLAAQNGAGSFVHTVKFRTEPRTGVNVTRADGQVLPVNQSDPIPLVWRAGDRDEQKVTFSRPGFVNTTIPLSASQASDAAASENHLFPPVGDPPIRLEPVHFWNGLAAWAEEHPLQTVFSSLLLICALTAGYGYLFHSLPRKRKQRELLEYYDSRRDPRDSMMMQGVGGYTLVQRLGQGGMATVYKALPSESMDESEAVAVKILAREIFRDKDFQRRFQREVRAYQKLDHPNIVRLHTWREPDGSAEEFPYIVLELVLGKTLAQLVPPQGWNWTEAAAILEQIFAAVQFAHDRGVVHRDLKLDNIMIAKEVVKVMDFGLARRNDDSCLTVEGTVLGTPAYMAPEQLSRGSAEPAVDQYALGVVTYKMLTGRLPHEADDTMQLFSMILTADPVPPRRYREDLRQGLEDVVLKILNKNPEDRFLSVSEAWSALRNAGEGV